MLDARYWMLDAGYWMLGALLDPELEQVLLARGAVPRLKLDK